MNFASASPFPVLEPRIEGCRGERTVGEVERRVMSVRDVAGPTV
jgi:hypothetical protein